MGRLFKGVSPVVASVLLIAFSIGIATIVGTWAMNYTQKELSSLEEKNYCKDVRISSLEFKYDPSSKEGMMRLQNTGEAIKGYRIYAFNDADQELLREVEEDMGKGDIRTFSFSAKLSGIKEIMVEVIDCPTVKIRVNI